MELIKESHGKLDATSEVVMQIQANCFTCNIPIAPSQVVRYDRIETKDPTNPSKRRFGLAMTTLEDGKIKTIMESSAFRAVAAFINSMHWVTYGTSIALSAVIDKIGQHVCLLFLAVTLGATGMGFILPDTFVWLNAVNFLLRNTRPVAWTASVIQGFGQWIALEKPTYTPKDMWNNCLVTTRGQVVREA